MYFYLFGALGYFSHSGNPLALKIVATSIADLFDGDIRRFLDAEVSMFSGIRQLLDQQFQGKRTRFAIITES